jgi:hypothetical protein
MKEKDNFGGIKRNRLSVRDWLLDMSYSTITLHFCSCDFTSQMEQKHKQYTGKYDDWQVKFKYT